MIKNFLALVGALVMILTVLGALGIGNFVVMYDFNPIVCIRGV